MIIKRRFVRMETDQGSSTGHNHSAQVQPKGAKKVRLIAEDGQPMAIEFTCSCGEVTVLALDYETAEAETARTDQAT